MNHSLKRGYSNAQQMMTLCAIAYSPLTSISTLQQKLDDAEALDNNYTALWLAANDKTALFLARNKLNNSCTLAVSGEVFEFGLPMLFHLYERFDLANQVSMPYSRLGNAKIAAGVLDAVQGIIELTYNGLPINMVLNDLPRGTRVYLTGHSLGGAFAGALATRLACCNLANLDIVPCTFGAPAMGNDAFADLFDKTKSNYLFTQSSSCFNTLDTFSLVWNRITGIYTVNFGNIRCPVEFTLCLECVDRLLILAKVFYVQPPPKHLLKGKLCPDFPFFRQAMHQHSQNTYLSLLGLGPIEGEEFSYAHTDTFVVADYL